MSYNNMSHQSYINTAGKITIITAILGVMVFAVVFLLNIGTTEIKEAVAQSRATTTVNVLNTPPQWVLGQEGREEIESSTSSPTNSGTEIAWIGTAFDSNGADYYLIVCSGTSTPTIPIASSSSAPTCAPGQIQWAVSTATVSSTTARAATTTIDRVTASSFFESNDWFAWVCDADPVSPRCFGTYSTGTAATNSSPFNVNSRPTFTAFSNDSPANPGAAVAFSSTADDADTVVDDDEVQLWVCAAQDFGTGTSTTECGPGGTLASSTFSLTNPTATLTLPSVYIDQDYMAYGYIIDNHGHAAIGAFQGSNATITVNNVAPTVDASQISINGGLDIVLTNAATQTPGFTLSFVTLDNNSCENSGNTPEVVDYRLSLYRSGIGSTTCDALTGTYDPNNCYVSTVPTTTWNISCAATTTPTDCDNSDPANLDPSATWECTFPLWYVADPTDDIATATPFNLEDWRAEIVPIDDDNATGTSAESTNVVDLLGLLAFALDTLQIPYGSIEPGSNTGTLTASTSMRATGNVGLDQLLQGTSMCPTYTSSTPCAPSLTSTIPATSQKYGTSTSFNYVTSPYAFPLSSTTPQELEINIPKSTSTVTQAARNTFWGIGIPGTISLSGDYYGQNTFFAKISEVLEW